MLNSEFSISRDPLKKAIEDYYRIDESECVKALLADKLSESAIHKIQARAIELVKSVREQRLSKSGIDAFMFQYDLSSDEGIALMCLAESLLRIPDKETIDKLIRDKLAQGNWGEHLSKSNSFFVNAATFGLMLTGRVLGKKGQHYNHEQGTRLTSVLKRLAAAGGEPIVRKAVKHAMKILGRMFVMGRTIEGAMKRALKKEAMGYSFSFDMLGEAALTQKDAQKYLAAYQHAIDVIAMRAHADPLKGNGISVKLSALHPRFSITKKDRLMHELLPVLTDLVLKAKAANVNITIDAEEAHTLMINLDLIEAIVKSGILGDWPGFGLAVQAYQKRAPKVLDWLVNLARQNKCKLMIRLVKGAYWDTEIKLAQVQGLSGYPVFTRKQATDVNYIHCAQKMLAATDVIYPQFATHNALTLATIIELTKEKGISHFEFQCLHGMGDTLYDHLVGEGPNKYNCRVYAPVGTHEDLLAYLVRRLLENGANTSFVNRIIDEHRSIEEMVIMPEQLLADVDVLPHPCIPLPINLYQPDRANSMGVDLFNPVEFLPVLEEIEKNIKITREAKPTSAGKTEAKETYSPISHDICLGTVHLATPEIVTQTLNLADKAYLKWRDTPAIERAQCLEQAAKLLHQEQNTLFSLLVYEGGKTMDDAISEVREAIDFCNYYASEAKKRFQAPQKLQGPTGEENTLGLHSRGVVACISPWNFPLAIFLGQVTAALAAGNCAIAKPASQTILIAAKAIEILHRAGFPKDVVQLLPGSGGVVGNALVNDLRIKGVVFTGSTQTARSINQQLANRQGPIVPFIAETGGQNAMIVDSSALPEQVTQDVLTSAFRSAGQRCSALRVLFVQEDVAHKMITMIAGAMQEMRLGHPGKLKTDVGPVIDASAKKQLEAHKAQMLQKAKLIAEVPLTDDCQKGMFFAPIAFEIPTLDWLTEEVFGPILHVIRFKGDDLDEVIAQINRTGYGLTLGIHSRIEETVDYIVSKVNVGNIYVNRNIIGAVVGVQPFGGEGLSGTGPKAGGPNYLVRLAHERTLSVNTTAAGGNASLMAMEA